MVQIIKEIDYTCFWWIQTHLRGIGDAFFMVMRNPNNLKWAYASLAVALLLRFKKRALAAMALLGGAMGFADLISSRVFKPFFHRLRPCQDVQWTSKGWHALVDCGSGFSFTSSHAATNMAAAVFLSLLFAPLVGKRSYIILTWGLLIGLAQVIVGLHYPIDILGGFIIGAFTAITFHFLYKRLSPKFKLA